MCLAETMMDLLPAGSRRPSGNRRALAGQSGWTGKCAFHWPRASAAAGPVQPRPVDGLSLADFTGNGSADGDEAVSGLAAPTHCGGAIPNRQVSYADIDRRMPDGGCRLEYQLSGLDEACIHMAMDG